jgi:hypothetical protein
MLLAPVFNLVVCISTVNDVVQILVILVSSLSISSGGVRLHAESP